MCRGTPPPYRGTVPVRQKQGLDTLPTSLPLSGPPQMQLPSDSSTHVTTATETPGQNRSDLGFQWSPLSDSNRRPTHYKCVALAS